jgi:hypothetical protein
MHGPILVPLARDGIGVRFRLDRRSLGLERDSLEDLGRLDGHRPGFDNGLACLGGLFCHGRA